MKLHLTMQDIKQAKTKIKKELRKEIKAKNQAYWERNQLVSVLSKLYPSGLGKHPAEDTSWEKEWSNIVYIDLPTGQASWHIHDRDLEYFKHLKPYSKEWDGHSTEEKYNRIAKL